MILGPSVLELLSDNHLVDGRTDRPTDKQTDMSKAIYPLFFEGGHNNYDKFNEKKTLVYFRKIAFTFFQFPENNLYMMTEI
jgi:hypothetical protein